MKESTTSPTPSRPGSDRPGAYLWTRWSTLLLAGPRSTSCSRTSWPTTRESPWKLVGWFAVLRAAAGVRDRARHSPAWRVYATPAVPLAIFVLVVLQLPSRPAQNAAVEYEQEADWVGLQTAREPRAAPRLFHRLAREACRSQTRRMGGRAAPEPSADPRAHRDGQCVAARGQCKAARGSGRPSAPDSLSTAQRNPRRVPDGSRIAPAVVTEPDYPLRFDVDTREALELEVLPPWLFAIPQFIIVYLFRSSSRDGLHRLLRHPVHEGLAGGGICRPDRALNREHVAYASSDARRVPALQCEPAIHVTPYRPTATALALADLR